MTRARRTIIWLAAAAVSLGLVASASAAYAPAVSIWQTSYAPGGKTGLGIYVYQENDEDNTAHVSIFVPAGYVLALSAPVGTEIGFAEATVNATKLGLSGVELEGVIQIADPAAFAAAATACTGSATHAATIAIVLDTSAGAALDPTAPTSVPIPAWIDPAAAPSSYHIQLCLPHPSTAPLGAQVRYVGAFLSAPAVTNPGPGGLVWHALFTPWDAAGTAPNPAGTTESQGVIVLPASVTIKPAKAKVEKGDKVVLSGTFVWGDPFKGETLVILGGSNRDNLKRIGTAKTGAGGKYTFTWKAKKKGPYFFQAVSVEGLLSDGCVDPLVPTCTGAIAGEVDSRIVKVTVR
jgi:hypothetical protein